MTKYVEPNRFSAKHTGKSGYFSTQSRPKPYPYGVAEEVASAFYPQYRPYIPKEITPYADSYLDLRNKEYKYWYDKWGKPHINKWWQSQLDAISTYEKARKQAQDGKLRDTRSKYNGRNYNYRVRRNVGPGSAQHICCRKCFSKHRITRQRQNYKRRTSYGTRKYRYRYKTYTKRWTS